jgi:hypothetical protein
MVGVFVGVDVAGAVGVMVEVCVAMACSVAAAIVPTSDWSIPWVGWGSFLLGRLQAASASARIVARIFRIIFITSLIAGM